MSIPPTKISVERPGAITPGQRITSGTWIPPSNNVPLLAGRAGPWSLEKTTMVRNDQGTPHRVDSGSKTVKAVWYVIPVLLTFFAAVGWLANQ